MNIRPPDVVEGNNAEAATAATDRGDQWIAFPDLIDDR
jgi:hypothetical protein